MEVVSNQNLSGQQFRQDSLWGEGSSVIGAADKQVRENMARRVTGAQDDPNFATHMGRSNATRADMLALEHVNPTVKGVPYISGGAYSKGDNIVEYGTSAATPSYEQRHTLYHELGHALHIGGQAYGGDKHGAPYNPDPIEEGVADGFATRLSKGGSGGAWTYRDSDQYNDRPTEPGVFDIVSDDPAGDITEGGPLWGKEGRAAYEASRSLAHAGEMPRAPHWSYRSGTVTKLTQTPGYSDTVKPEHQQGMQPTLDRDSEGDRLRNEQQKLF